jgi:hypothetical protein
MAVDYAEKEREFLESLAADTGRDLAGWMAAISATSLIDRNAIIDWLRQQGFLFAKASWLERIHHNGGRPIYLDPASVSAGAPPRERVDPSPPSPPVSALPASSPVNDLPSVAFALKAPEPAVPVAVLVTKASEDTLIDALLAEAKAYRPLAQFTLREIEKVVPGIVFEARNGYIAIQRNGTLAGVLTIAPKELRLALAWRTGFPPSLLTKAKFTKMHSDIPPEVSHMVILTDARQVTPELVSAVARAAGVR